MERRNLRDFWLFWHEGLRDTFDVIVVVDRHPFLTTARFYWHVASFLNLYGANAKDALEHLDMLAHSPIGDPERAAERAAELFRDVVKTLPHPYFVGMTDDLRDFVIAMPRTGIDPANAKPVSEYGKWLLVDDITRERYTPVAVRRIYCEMSGEYPLPLERAYRGAIEAMMLYGAKATYLSKPNDVWQVLRSRNVLDAFRQAIATLPKPYRVGISDSLLEFYVLQPR